MADVAGFASTHSPFHPKGAQKLDISMDILGESLGGRQNATKRLVYCRLYLEYSVLAYCPAAAIECHENCIHWQWFAGCVPKSFGGNKNRRSLNLSIVNVSRSYP
ncbi:MAG: hypothetical protein ACK53L_27155, partial [Pirellulaceae bacterium]